MSANIRLPHITEGPEREQLAQVKSYLHQLVNELNYQLDIIGSQGGGNLYENTRTGANNPSVSNTKMIQLQQEKIEAMEKEMRELRETVLSALRKHNIDI